MRTIFIIWRALKNPRRYRLAELPAWLVLAMTMLTIAQAWFWSKKAAEFGDLFIREFDKYGPFYWAALYCFIALICLGFLALAWASIAIHLQQNLQARLFPKT